MTSSGTRVPAVASGAMPTASPTAARPVHAPGDHLRAEHRRDQEQRRDARDDEHEARHLLLRELLQQLVHGPTRSGMLVYSACV